MSPARLLASALRAPWSTPDAAPALVLLCLLLGAPLQAQKVGVKEATPDRIRLLAGEAPATVTLLGAGLEAVAGAWVGRSGRPVREVTARARLVAKDELEVELSTDASAPSFRGELVLRSRDGTETPVPGLAVEVVTAEPRVRELVPGSAELQEGTSGGLSVVLERRAAAPVSVRLTTSDPVVQLPDQATVPAGADRVKVGLRVGRVAAPSRVRLSAETRGGRADVTVGVAPRPTFSPLRATTGALAFTGLSFEPRSATTGALTFTGLSFQPRQASTPALTFTGLSFQPRRTTTPALVFTGLTPPSQED